MPLALDGFPASFTLTATGDDPSNQLSLPVTGISYTVKKSLEPLTYPGVPAGAGKGKINFELTFENNQSLLTDYVKQAVMAQAHNKLKLLAAKGIMPEPWESEDDDDDPEVPIGEDEAEQTLTLMEHTILTLKSITEARGELASPANPEYFAKVRTLLKSLNLPIPPAFLYFEEAAEQRRYGRFLAATTPRKLVRPPDILFDPFTRGLDERE